MDRKEVRRAREREKARALRRRRRKRIVLIEKLVVAGICVAVLVGGGLMIYHLLPGVKVSKQLKEANAYMESESYDDAIASCEEALKIDSSSVQAYRAMAGAYLTKEDASSAEQVLYRGWEATQDEGLLDYYCTVLLNEAVAEINEGSCNLDTLDKCVTVLEKNSSNSSVYELLNACCDRLFTFGEDTSELLLTENGEANDRFVKYQELLDRMLQVYGTEASDELVSVISKALTPAEGSWWIPSEHLSDYITLLSSAENTVGQSEVSELKACAEKAKAMQDLFAEAFTILESGEFAPIREFMNSSEYLDVRDSFMNETMDYWTGKTYIPVSREKVRIIHEDGVFQFAFADFEEGECKTDVINVWTAKQEDAGVQRVIISYEPASENGEYFPHTTYEFIYLYSNVETSKGVYTPQMNYRFETRIETENGTTATVIGDWGGEHEYEMEF